MNIWDQYARAYKKIQPHSSLYMGLLKQTKKDIADATTIADVGTGVGTVAQHIAQMQKSVTGFDSNAEMLAIARETTNSNIADFVSFVESDAHVLNAPDKSYNGIICLNVLYAVEDPYAVLREISRIAKEKAIVIISGPMPNLDVTKLKEIEKVDFNAIKDTLAEEINVFQECNKQLIRNHMPNTYTLHEIKVLMEEHGFKVNKLTTSYQGMNYYVVAQKITS